MSEENSHLPIDRGWAWVICFGYFITTFCMVGIAKSFGIIMLELKDYFDIPMALAALVIGVSGITYTLLAPFAISLGLHVTQRKVVIFGGLIGAIGLSLCSLLVSIEYVIVMFGVLVGAGNACIFGNGLIMVGNYFKKYRTIANGLSLSGASIGQFAIPPLLRYLLNTYALKGAFLISGAIYFHVLICGAVYRPISFYEKRKKVRRQENGALMSSKNSIPDKEKTESAAERNALIRQTSTGSMIVGEESHSEYKKTDEQSRHNDESKSSKCQDFFIHLVDFSVLKNYIVIMYVLVSFFLFFGYFNFILFMPGSAESKGVDKFDVAWLVSIAGICDLVGRISVGIFGDLNFFKRYKIMVGVTMLCGINVFIFEFTDRYWWMGLHIGLYGLFGGAFVAINAPVLIDLVGLKTMPKALGVVLLIQGVGAAIGQPLLGKIRDVSGGFREINIILSVSQILGSLLLCSYPLVRSWEEKHTQGSESHPGFLEQVSSDKGVEMTFLVSDNKSKDGGGDDMV